MKNIFSDNSHIKSLLQYVATCARRYVSTTELILTTLVSYSTVNNEERLGVLVALQTYLNILEISSLYWFQWCITLHSCPKKTQAFSKTMSSQSIVSRNYGQTFGLSYFYTF